MSFNAPLSFDVGSVTLMYQLFYGASVFNQPLDFDSGRVGDMSYLFSSAAVSSPWSAFDQPVSLDTRSVTDMNYSTLRESNSHSSDPNRRAPLTRGSED